LLLSAATDDVIGPARQRKRRKLAVSAKAMIQLACLKRAAPMPTPASKTSIPKNAISVFIDASNLWQAQKAKGRFLNYEKLTAYIQERFNGTSITVFYYTAYPKEGTRAYSVAGKHAFYTYLKKGLGFVVRKKELKQISVVSEHGEAIQEKGNMDVEMTIDAVHHCNSIDTAILFTGDSDFQALIQYLRNNGKKVFVFSSKHNISQELKTGSDGYTDILTIPDDIWGRELKRRTDFDMAA
jgi:uncharacterized LabA/DUF88 family protein